MTYKLISVGQKGGLSVRRRRTARLRYLRTEWLLDRHVFQARFTEQARIRL